ncbi:hypothetical protein AB0957_34730 [Streptomyces zhihengii]|uniref:hypothetical protein n=1 Tax=Streptomyces zhihengii TaxID=1818004 RepID=UPI003451B02B
MTLIDRTSDHNPAPSVPAHQPGAGLQWFTAIVGAAMAGVATYFGVTDRPEAAAAAAVISAAAFAGSLAITVSINVRRR